MSERTLPSWNEVYAEILGCENSPPKIIAAIDDLKKQVSQLQEQVNQIPEIQNDARRKGEDATIRRMRNAAVNCGMQSSCSVANWTKCSDEE